MKKIQYKREDRIKCQDQDGYQDNDKNQFLKKKVCPLCARGKKEQRLMIKSCRHYPHS